MDSAFLCQILQDAFFAAIAAVGFAMVMNPAARTLTSIALIAALGHALRFVLMGTVMGNITLASFAAALCIGLLSVCSACRLRCPAGSLAFPSLLPMIPGMYAYNAVLALVHFSSAGQDEALQVASVIAFFDNGLTTLSVMCALVVGILIPIQIFRRLPLTRGGDIR